MRILNIRGKYTGVLVFVGILYWGFSSCETSSSEKKYQPPIINLDVVLSAFDKTSDSYYRLITDNKADSVASFIQTFSRNINEKYAKKYDSQSKCRLRHPIELNLLNNGSLEGYLDENMNQSKDSNEMRKFLVEFYGDSAKVIATDTNNGYIRFHHYRRSALGSIMFTTYFINRMLIQQKTAGVNSEKFSNYKFNKKGYLVDCQSNRQKSARDNAKSTSRSGGNK